MVVFQDVYDLFWACGELGCKGGADRSEGTLDPAETDITSWDVSVPPALTLIYERNCMSFWKSYLSSLRLVSYYKIILYYHYIWI